MWILVGETEKLQSLSLMARHSEDRMPPDAKRRMKVLSRRLLQFKSRFRITFTSISSWSLCSILGILTLRLNFDGITSYHNTQGMT